MGPGGEEPSTEGAGPDGGVDKSLYNQNVRQASSSVCVSLHLILI